MCNFKINTSSHKTSNGFKKIDASKLNQEEGADFANSLLDFDVDMDEYLERFNANTKISQSQKRNISSTSLQKINTDSDPKCSKTDENEDDSQGSKSAS